MNSRSFSRSLVFVKLVMLSLGWVSNSAHAEIPPVNPKFCLAIPGNGSKIFSHFGSAARIFETVGTRYELEGLAAESSGSIAAFLLETIASSPLVSECPSGPCRLIEKNQRIALLMKSLMGYVSETTQSAEVQALTGLFPAIKKLAKISLNPVTKFRQFAEVRRIFNVLEQNRHYARLINPVWKEKIREAHLNPRKILATLTELKAVADIQHALGFTNNVAIFREGLLNFDYVVLLLGRIADFYAAQEIGDHERLQRFVETCSEVSPGRTWDELVRDTLKTRSCGSLFSTAVRAYRSRVSSQVATSQGRISENVGSRIPTLIASAVIDTREGQRAFAHGLDYYDLHRGEVPAEEFPLNKKFPFKAEYLNIGYWGLTSSLDKVSKSERYTEPRWLEHDARARAFRAMGAAPWQEALRNSISEPGGSRAKPIRAGSSILNAGGWPDPSPVHVLQGLGCKNIVLISRPPGLVGFYSNILKIYNQGNPQMKGTRAYDHFSPRNPVGEAQSSERQARRDSTVLWCSDWDQAPQDKLDQIFEAGYRTRDVFSKLNFESFLPKDQNTECPEPKNKVKAN